MKLGAIGGWAEGECTRHGYLGELTDGVVLWCCVVWEDERNSPSGLGRFQRRNKRKFAPSYDSFLSIISSALTHIL